MAAPSLQACVQRAVDFARAAPPLPKVLQLAADRGPRGLHITEGEWFYSRLREAVLPLWTWRPPPRGREPLHRLRRFGEELENFSAEHGYSTFVVHAWDEPPYLGRGGTVWEWDGGRPSIVPIDRGGYILFVAARAEPPQLR